MTRDKRENRPGPLNGVRVVDLSRLAPGPFCSMVLGDLGAEVLVVEPPTDTRVPPGAGTSGEDVTRQAAFNALRRNKRSIIVNLKEEEGRTIFLRLAKEADVILEGFRPGVVQRLGVDYATVSRLNPKIVYCSLSGYGQTGPYADRVGHDINYIALAGALGLFGWPGGPPAFPMNLLADFAGGGLHAAMAIIAALFARERDGQGQYIDIAMSDGVIYLMASVFSQALSGRGAPKRGEHLLTGGTPYYNVYETADNRWISIGSLEPHFFANLCKALKCEQFIPHQNDLAKRPEIFDYFRRTFRDHPLSYWVAKLTQTDVCVAPVYSLDEVIADPHNQHRGMIAELASDEVGPIRQVGVGPKFSRTPGSVRVPGPPAGKHTAEVLRSLGFSDEDVSRLLQSGVVQ